MHLLKKVQILNFAIGAWISDSKKPKILMIVLTVFRIK